MKKPDIPFILMLAITALYAAAAYINLGDVKAPQTFTEIMNREQIVVDLGGQTDITRIVLYAGICDGKFTFECSDDSETWRAITDSFNENGEIADEEDRGVMKPDYSTSFSWFVMRINENAGYLRITARNSGGKASVGMLGEIGVFNGDVQIPVVLAEKAEIADEQEFVRRSNNFMNSTYFDEIYHARTAYEILNKKTIYETTHPPLGKLIIAIGIKIFGMTPFGWRFTGTLFGIAMLPVMFFLAKKTLEDGRLAVLATALLALDFMHFSLTRISTIDSYPVFFIMLTFLFLFEYTRRAGNTELKSRQRVSPLILSGLFFGLGCASKWNTLYSAAGILVIILLTWRRAVKENPGKNNGIVKRIIICDFLVGVMVFIIIPAVIYVVSYIPQVYEGSLIKTVINAQKFMFNYHSQLKAEHPFSSPVWSWPVILTPLWAYMDSEAGAYGLTGAINIMGTPIIWYLGFAAAVLTIVWAFLKRKFTAVFISISYLTQYVFWLLVPRIAYIYHYFASVPFMILAICFWMGEAPRWAKIALIAAAVVLFAAFYPVLSGIRIPLEYAKWLVWNKNWFIFSWE
jgi:dolichyl-phosphate-mannose--protein O-mannosyl transferase